MEREGVRAGRLLLRHPDKQVRGSNLRGDLIPSDQPEHTKKVVEPLLPLDGNGGRRSHF